MTSKPSTQQQIAHHTSHGPIWVWFSSKFPFLSETKIETEAFPIENKIGFKRYAGVCMNASVSLASFLADGDAVRPLGQVQFGHVVFFDTPIIQLVALPEDFGGLRELEGAHISEDVV